MTTTAPAKMYGPALQKMIDAFPKLDPPTTDESINNWWHHPDNPKFDVIENDKGWITIHSWTGRSTEEILSIGGLTPADIHPKGYTNPRTTPQISVTTLSQGKRIHHSFLFNLGLKDGYKYKGRLYVGIPYFNEDGTQRMRIRVRKALVGEHKQCWDEGTPGDIVAYGLHKLSMAREQQRLFIGEGETDAWACWLHDIPYLGIPGADFQKCLTGLDLNDIPAIYILVEPDQFHKMISNGQGFYKNVHDKLRKEGYNGDIFFIDFKKTGYKDPSDMHIQLWDAGPPDLFKQKMEEAFNQAIPANDMASVEMSLPEIVIGGQLRDVTGFALDALSLQEKGNPTLFLQQGQIKRIVRDERQKPVISDVSEPEMRVALTESANYFREKEKAGEFFMVPVSPPKDVVQSILALRPEKLPFPAIEAIVQIPVLRKNGTILDTPGYDPTTCLYYMPQHGLDMPAIPQAPTQNDAIQAMSFIEGFIQDFPWEDSADKANALGLLLTTVTRQMFKHVPIALVDATKAGTGKGLFTDEVNFIATGHGTAALSPGRNDEELDKQITAMLLAGETMITVDNVDGVLRSPILAKILTSEYHKGRVLGQSKMVDVAQRAIWIANGNNLQVGGDIARRSYRMRMISQVSNPDERDDFKYPDLDQAVHEQRGTIIAALLTIARAWFVAGCPAPAEKLRKIGSFTHWSDTIGGILSYAGVTGFLKNVAILRKEADVDGAAWSRFLEIWKSKIGDEAFTTAQLINLLGKEKELAEALPEPLGTLYAKEDKSLSRKIGRILAKQNGTPYGAENLRIIKGEDSHQKVSTFQVAGYSIPSSKVSSSIAGYAGYCGLETKHAHEKKSDSSGESELEETPVLSDNIHIENGAIQTRHIPHTPQPELELPRGENQYPAKYEQAMQFWKQFISQPDYGLRLKEDDTTIVIAVPESVTDAEFEAIQEKVLSQGQELIEVLKRISA